MLPVVLPLKNYDHELIDICVEIAHEDWDNFENSWDFRDLPLLRSADLGSRYQTSLVTVRKECTLAESWDNYATY